MRRRAVHHDAGRRGGVAAGGARAAARADAAGRRAYKSGGGRSRRAGPQHRLRAGAGAIGLDCRPEPKDGTSLGFGRCRTHSQIRRRIGRIHPGCRAGHWACRRRDHCCKQPAQSRSYSCSFPIRSALVSLTAWRDRAAMRRDLSSSTTPSARKWLELLKEIAPVRDARGSPSRSCHHRGPAA